MIPMTLRKWDSRLFPGFPGQIFLKFQVTFSGNRQDANPHESSRGAGAMLRNKTWHKIPGFFQVFRLFQSQGNHAIGLSTKASNHLWHNCEMKLFVPYLPVRTSTKFSGPPEKTYEHRFSKRENQLFSIKTKCHSHNQNSLPANQTKTRSQAQCDVTPQTSVKM